MPFTSIATITGRVSTGADGLCWRQPYQFNHVLQIYYVFDLCDFTLFLLLHKCSLQAFGDIMLKGKRSFTLLKTTC